MYESQETFSYEQEGNRVRVIFDIRRIWISTQSDYAENITRGHKIIVLVLTFCWNFKFLRKFEFWMLDDIQFLQYFIFLLCGWSVLIPQKFHEFEKL